MSFVPWSQMVESMKRIFFFHLPATYIWCSRTCDHFKSVQLKRRNLRGMQEPEAFCRNLRTLFFTIFFCVERKKASTKTYNRDLWLSSKQAASLRQFSRAHKISWGPDAKHHFSATGAGHWQSRSRAKVFQRFVNITTWYVHLPIFVVNVCTV